MDKIVQNYIVNLPVNPAIKNWQSNIKTKRPLLEEEDISANLKITDKEINKKIAASIKKNLIDRNDTTMGWRPELSEAIIASDGGLHGDPVKMESWKKINRKIAGVDMESIGAYEATKDKCPIMIIRGVSDIVGFEKNDDWVNYACETSAAFAYTLIKNEKNLPFLR